MQVSGRWIDIYTAINESYRKTLVFRVGASAGFYSEYNNMILAVIYCLNNSIRFVICDRNANFSKERGLNDFFEPCFSRDNKTLHLLANNRPFNLKTYPKIRKLLGFILKNIYSIDYLTQDVWHYIRGINIEAVKISIPQLNLHNKPLVKLTKVVIENIYVFNAGTQFEINHLLNGINLPKTYIGVHIRRGDKKNEADLLDLQVYIRAIEIYNTTNNLFILSDDYTVITEIKRIRPTWNIYTLVKSSHTGYANKEFTNLGNDKKRVELINLFASMEALTNSDVFIGTFSSNIGMFLMMRRGGKNCYSADGHSWTII